MFGSQALETAIGLALMLFVFATAASAITEIFSAAVKKRSGDLKRALKDMFSSGELPGGLAAVTQDSVDDFIRRATGRVNTSYMSAKSFADAATELVSKGHNIGALQARMDTLAREARGQIDEVKAGLENWFDEAMAGAQDRYSKWASFVLLGTGLVLTVVLNASIINVGQDLWTDAAAREAVVEAAGNAEQPDVDCVEEGTAIEQAKCSVDSISTFQLPIGWSETQRDGWVDGGNATFWWWVTHAIGWLLTAVLLMLGAPFWFDLLGKLVNLRSGGQRPATAANDSGSYSTKVNQAGPPAPPPAAQLVPNRQRVVANLRGSRLQPNLTVESFDAMTAAERVSIIDNATSAMFVAPSPSDAQSVDWLATALNLGVPMVAIEDHAEVNATAQPNQEQ